MRSPAKLVAAALVCAVACVVFPGCEQRLIDVAPRAAAGASHGPELVGSEANFDALVLKSDVPVLVDFYATWCVPCQSIAPLVSELAERYEGKLKVIKVDGDLNRGLLETYGVEAFPTFMIFDKGQPVDKLLGADPSGLQRLVANHVRA